MMGLVNIDDIRVGMVLGADLYTVQGRLLLPQGTMFTEKHLKVCRIWGINEAEIEGAEEDASRGRLEDYPPEIIAAAKQIVSNRFRLTDIKDSATAELARQVVLFEAARIKESGRKTERVEPAIDVEKAPSPSNPLPSLKQFVEKDLELVSLPDICTKILEALRSPKSSASFLANIVGNDQNLSLKILKVVNSPYYGLVAKVDTLPRAVALLGVEQLINISMSLTMMIAFQGIPKEFVNMRSFWKHGIACGLTAKLLAKSVHNPEPERFFLMGLLHDIGKLVMFKLYPEHALAALVRSREKKSPGYITENVLWGFNHATLLDVLLREWGFPPSMLEALPYHHKPESSPALFDAAIIHVADFIVNGVGLGDGSSAFVPPLSKSAWGELDLSRNVLGGIVQKLHFQLSEVMGAFFE